MILVGKILSAAGMVYFSVLGVARYLDTIDIPAAQMTDRVSWSYGLPCVVATVLFIIYMLLNEVEA